MNLNGYEASIPQLTYQIGFGEETHFDCCPRPTVKDQIPMNFKAI